MCHRFTMLDGGETDRVIDYLQAVRRALDAGMGLPDAVPPSFARPPAIDLEAIDCYPGMACSVILAEGRDLVREELTWGIEVSWQRNLVFNARIESALSGSAMWREAFEGGRCLVPVRAFFETQNVMSPTDGGRYRGDGAVEQGVFGMEGPRTLVDEARHSAGANSLGAHVQDTRPSDARSHGRRPQWRFADGAGAALLLAGLRVGDCFAVVTCEPNDAVASVHNRMPLVFTAPEALSWLDGPAVLAASVATDRSAIALIAEREAPAPSSARRGGSATSPDQLSLF